MNYAAWLVWGLVCLAIIFFILFSIQESNGYDYIETYIEEGGFKETPVICIYEPIPHKYLVLKGAKAWEVELRKYTASNLYDYRIKLVKVFETDCNILVKFGDPIELMNGGSPLGVAQCGDWEGERLCKIAVNWEYSSSEEISRTTLTHELGHALGIGHRMPLDNSNHAGVGQIVLEDDIMFKQASPFDKITKQDMDALLFMYNYSGYIGGINQTYTIPH